MVPLFSEEPLNVLEQMKLDEQPSQQTAQRQQRGGGQTSRCRWEKMYQQEAAFIVSSCRQNLKFIQSVCSTAARLRLWTSVPGTGQLQRALPSEWEVLDPSVSGRFPRFRLKKSCCVLDNICIQRKEPIPVDQDVLPEDFDPCADFEIVELKIHVHFFFFSLTATIWVLAASGLWKCFWKHTGGTKNDAWWNLMLLNTSSLDCRKNSQIQITQFIFIFEGVQTKMPPGATG